MTKTKNEKLGGLALSGISSPEYKFDPTTIYPNIDEPFPPSALPVSTSPAPKSRHRPVAIAALSALVLVIAMTGVVAAIAHIHNKPPAKPVAANVQTKAKLPVAVTPKTVNNPTAPASSNKVLPKQSSKQPIAPVKQPSSVIQQAPQLPTQGSSSSPPYVGSLPSTVPVYTSGAYNFYYVGGRQYANATGASATLSQAQPVVPEQPSAENHSLIELAVQSADGQQIVEVGWVVDSTMNGDNSPHLFVYHWVAGQTSCYNGCGFVQVSSSVIPGQTVSVGTTASYGINYISGNWDITYNSAIVGYFPASLWAGTFTQLGYVQVFGEVANSTSSTTHCIQMGDGLGGSSSTSSKISNFALTGSNVGVALSPFATSPSSYSYGFASATSLNLGGPGSC